MGMPQQPAAYNAGVGYPVNQSIDGNLSLVDPYGNGQYGNLTARSISAQQITGPILTMPAATGDQSGGKDTASMAVLVDALVAGNGGAIIMPAGAYYIKTGQITALQQNGTLFLAGAGIGSTVIYAVGAGDCIRMYNPTSPPGGFPGLAVYGGGVLDLTIDGSLASAGATGLHIGDGEHYQVRVQIQHFNGAGLTGLHIDNSVWWTEKGDWRGIFLDCTTCVLQTTESGNNSNAENDFFWTFFLNPSQNAIVMQGISHYLGKLTCRGVFNANPGAGGNTGVWLTGDASSSINNCEMDVSLNLGSSGASPQTMNLAIPGFSFQSNTGRLLFGGAGGWTPASSVFWAANITAFNFAGDVLGDVNIHPASATSSAPPQATLMLTGNPVLYAQGFIAGGSGHINDFGGDYFSAQLSASITIGLGGGPKGSCPGPQRKTIVLNQPASGSLFTVTWPHTASPTTSSPTVKWAGGTAPTMTASHGAVDVYMLETVDGATWYGTASQNVS